LLNESRQQLERMIDELYEESIDCPRLRLYTRKARKKYLSFLKKRKKFRRRAAIEPVIGHLKKDFRMEQNYLNGSNSPQINAMLAATGWNMKKLIKKLKQELLWLYFSLEKVLKKLINQNKFTLNLC